MFLSLLWCAHFCVFLSVRIGVRSELHPGIEMNIHAEKSNMSSYSGMKNCAADAGFVFIQDQILSLMLASAELAQREI